MLKENCLSSQFTTSIVVVAFLTKKQAKRAINNRLLIAGFFAKVNKFISTSSTA